MVAIVISWAGLSAQTTPAHCSAAKKPACHAAKAKTASTVASLPDWAQLPVADKANSPAASCQPSPQCQKAAAAMKASNADEGAAMKCDPADCVPCPCCPKDCDPSKCMSADKAGTASQGVKVSNTQPACQPAACRAKTSTASRSSI